MADEEPVTYLIDEKGVIREANDAWDRFALANEGAHLVREKVVGRSLWAFLSDPTVVQIYRRLVGSALEGRTISFSFRCDGPSIFRLLDMTIQQVGSGRVEFRSVLRVAAPRQPNPLLDARAARRGPFVRICGWCHRVGAKTDQWIELEEALQALGIFSQATVPPLTHGICERCRDEMISLIDGSSPS